LLIGLDVSNGVNRALVVTTAIGGKAVIGQNANVSKVPNSEHVMVGKDVSCTG
jgi:hypothetical protein